MNGGFWDLSPDERGAAYDAAERDHGGSFWDLDPDTRGRYYDAATEGQTGGNYIEQWF